MKILFRTDASIEIGSGHVMRTLTLARVLRNFGFECIFVCRDFQGNLINTICESGFRVDVLKCEFISDKVEDRFFEESVYSKWLGVSWEIDAAQTKECIGEEIVEWIVVDHYAIDYRWEGLLRKSSKYLMVVDDLANRKHDCDILVDQNWMGDQTDIRYDALVKTSCAKLLGPSYALLASEYTEIRRAIRIRDGVVRKILIFLGGTDSTNQTAKVLRALDHPSLFHINLDVVLGVNHPDPIGIRRLSASRPKTVVYQGLPSLASLMNQADLMIGAGGTTTWERMCLGVPSIVMSIAENQTTICKNLGLAGYLFFLGEMNTVTVNSIFDMVSFCVSNPEILRSQSASIQNLVRGDGVNGVAKFLQQYSNSHASTNY